MTVHAPIRLASAAIAWIALASTAHAQLRISQVGKGSGLNVNAYNGQFVELYNAGAAPVALAGKSIQSASSAGSTAWSKFDLDGTIAPGGYWLVRLTATTTFNLANAFGVPFDADQTRIGFNGTFFSLASFGEFGGKVVLSDSTTLFTTTGCAAPDAGHVLDMVSWDDVPSSAVCHEGSACALIPPPGAFAGGIGSTAVLRKCGGQTDTDDNFNDFTTAARPPRNSHYAGAVDAPAVSAMTQVTGQSDRGATTGYAGQTVLFTSGPSTCSGSITGVAINLAPIGGLSSQVMRDDGSSGDAASGDGIFTFLYTIPASPIAPVGNHLLAITAVDSNGRAGTGLAVVTIAPTPPLNDLCGSAVAIAPTALPMFVSAAGNLVSAGPITQVATGCTTNGGNAGTSRDVWFSFTPMVSASYTVSTCNNVTAPGLFTSQNTVLSIHASCPPDDVTDLSGLTLACDDEGCTTFIGGGPSTIASFPMSAGTTYLLRVARFGSNTSIVGAPFRLDITSESFGACCLHNGSCVVGLESACPTSVGTFTLNGITCTEFGNCPAPPAPENNECMTATTLATGVAAPGTSYGASGSDITTCDDTSWDVWYNYTPATTGPFRVTATLVAGSQTPAISLFAACPPVTNANFACITAPLSGTVVNTLTFAGTAGSLVYIRIATHFSQRSDFTVLVDQPGVCCRGSTCAVGIAPGNCLPSGSAGAVFVPADACNSGSAATTPCCHADFNKVGGVSVQDIFDYLGAYFASGPLADMNGNGSTTVQDIFDFLAAYFRGCN